MISNCWIFSMGALLLLLCLEIACVLASNQYHIQSDEGPERYFRFQTSNGQFRKERRLQDGTVIGTEAWIDAAGYLRLTDYIADKQGYRILKSKTVYVGEGADIEDAIKSTKSVPAQTGTLVDGKRGLPNRPNSIVDNNFNKLSPVLSSVSSTTAPPPLLTTTERPILGYLSPAEAAKLEPSPYLGFDHYPNELPKKPKIRQQLEQSNYDYSTTTERPSISLPSLNIEPPKENSRTHEPTAVASVNPQPVSINEVAEFSNGFSTPKPFEAVLRSTTAADTGYQYAPSSYPLSNQSPQVQPIDVNALESGLLPPLPPPYQRRRIPIQSNYYAPHFASEYNDVTATRDGFRYVLPHHYHEEEQIHENKKAGSFGYVDPFGIRRVVYYNTSPEKGFVHRNRNNYVGLEAQPYDEPQPSDV